MPPVSGIAPGFATSPMTKTRWLRYSATSTVTWGCFSKPSARRALRSASIARTVSPAAFTRPRSGNVSSPSLPTVYLPVMAASPYTAIDSTSVGPTTYSF